jgi:serine/threonine protein phosphatase PrpC
MAGEYLRTGCDVLIEYGVQTDLGLRRVKNEDTAVAGKNGGWFLVADGMGGHAAGEVASQLAASTVTELLGDGCILDSNPNLVLRRLAQEANARVFEAQRRRPECAGMGTTLTLLAFRQDRYYIAHVGDSRAYRLRDGVIRQLTKDHSVVWQLFENAILTKQELSRHPNKNLITRSIGTHPQTEIDIEEEEIRQEDIFLLCSDGLTDVVPDESIREILSQGGKNPQQLCAELVASALDAGGPDNVTSIVVRLRFVPEGKTAEPPDPARRMENPDTNTRTNS